LEGADVVAGADVVCGLAPPDGLVPVPALVPVPVAVAVPALAVVPALVVLDVDEVEALLDAVLPAAGVWAAAPAAGTVNAGAPAVSAVLVPPPQAVKPSNRPNEVSTAATGLDR
jgi:hypothetical protein